jgi:hypothetical protein
MNGMINPNTIIDPGSPEVNKQPAPVEAPGGAARAEMPAPAERSFTPAAFAPVMMPSADVAAAIMELAAPASNAAAAAPTVQLPAVADTDKIEPEWVAATEKAIKNTAGNPYAEEEAVEDLQIDYQKKRFNRELKKGPNV